MNYADAITAEVIVPVSNDLIEACCPSVSHLSGMLLVEHRTNVARPGLVTVVGGGIGGNLEYPQACVRNGPYGCSLAVRGLVLCSSETCRRVQHQIKDRDVNGARGIIIKGILRSRNLLLRWKKSHIAPGIPLRQPQRSGGGDG